MARFPQLPVDRFPGFFMATPQADPGARQPFSIILKHNGTISVLSRKFVTDLFFVVCAELRLIGENKGMLIGYANGYIPVVCNIYI
jgi:hypothetical protein